MNFVGCDLHKKTITICAVQQNRVPLANRRFGCTDTAGIAVWLARFRPFELVVEATGKLRLPVLGVVGLGYDSASCPSASSSSMGSGQPFRLM